MQLPLFAVAVHMGVPVLVAPLTRQTPHHARIVVGIHQRRRRVLTSRSGNTARVCRGKDRILPSRPAHHRRWLGSSTSITSIAHSTRQEGVSSPHAARDTQTSLRTRTTSIQQSARSHAVIHRHIRPPQHKHAASVIIAPPRSASTRPAFACHVADNEGHSPTMSVG